MVYRCYSCKRVLDTYEIVTAKFGGKKCGFCNSTNIKPVDYCPICGDYAVDGKKHCQSCIDDLEEYLITPLENLIKTESTPEDVMDGKETEICPICGDESNGVCRTCMSLVMPLVTTVEGVLFCTRNELKALIKDYYNNKKED